jgi:hypothetical protein
MFVAYYPHFAGLFQREKTGFAEFARPGTRDFAGKHSASNRYGTELRNGTSDYQERFLRFPPADLAGRRTIHKVFERLHRPA